MGALTIRIGLCGFIIIIILVITLAIVRGNLEESYGFQSDFRGGFHHGFVRGETCSRIGVYKKRAPNTTLHIPTLSAV